MSMYAKAGLFLVAGVFSSWLMTQRLHQSLLALYSVFGLLLGLIEAAFLDGTRRRWATVLLGVLGGGASIITATEVTGWMPYPVRDVVYAWTPGIVIGIFLALPRLSLVLMVQYALGGLLGSMGATELFYLAHSPLHHLGVPGALVADGYYGFRMFGIALVPALFQHQRREKTDSPAATLPRPAPE